ncbi:MAG: isoprenylcysteine carboxylmethyltransferase family protein [Candidatus Paceibacterota bacterium]
METEQKENKINSHPQRGSMVHFVLLHSYLIFLFAVVLGAFLDPLIKKKIFSNDIYQTIGFLMLIVGSILIYWAQETSSNYQQRVSKDDSRSYFEFGPYRYLRSPTHFGLFIMTLGFSLIINSLFGVVLIIVAYAVTKFFFLKKEEKLLETKYGQVYLDYKKKVKNWI